MAKRTILVAGALGVIGRALVEHCESDPDVEIVGLVRRSPEFESTARFIAVDLLDRAACERSLVGLTGITPTSCTRPGRRGRPGKTRWRPTSRCCAISWRRLARALMACAT